MPESLLGDGLFGQRTLGDIGFGSVFALVEIDVDHLQASDVFLGQEHEHPARIGRAISGIEFHGEEHNARLFNSRRQYCSWYTSI